MVEYIKNNELNTDLQTGIRTKSLRSSFGNDNIFSSSGFNINKTENEDLELLEEQLDNVMKEQGLFSSAWNEVKEFSGIGTSEEKCDDIIDKYKNGEITYEEAEIAINNFDQKQESSLNLFSNIITSFAAIAAGAAVVAATGGIGLPVILAGMGAGAAAKSTFKFVDRATNELKGDALDKNQLAKDALSGAITGGIAAATMGTGSASTTLKSSVVNCAKGCAKTGAITGGISGGANYAIDCAFDEDKDFKFNEFTSETLKNAALGASVGAIMGSLNGTLRYQEILTADKYDVLADTACSASYKLLNDRIKTVMT